MPQEPKRRHSRQRKGKRRASIRLNIPRGVACLNCGALNPSHVVCEKCGFYNRRQVIIKKEKPKKEKDEKSS